MTPLDPTALLDLSSITELAVSPDGDRVAFVARECDPDADERVHSLFVAPTDGSDEPYRLTRVDDASDPRWSPDGTKLAFLAARERDASLRVGMSGDDADGESGESSEGDETGEEGGEGEAEDETSDAGDDDPRTQVWVFDFARGGDARQVTEREEGVDEFDWSPDGGRLVVAARDPTDEEREYLDRLDDGGPVEVERLQHKYDGAGWLDAVRTYLFVVDLETREETRLDATGFEPGLGEEQAGRQPRWGPTDRIAFLGYEGERPDDTAERDVYLIDPDGENRERLTEGGIANDSESDQGATAGSDRGHASDGEGDQRATEGSDRGIAAGALRWSPDGSRLSFTARDPENWYRPVRLCVADPETGESRALTDDLDRTIGWGEPAWLDDDSLVVPLADGGWTRLARARVDGTAGRVFERQSRDESILDLDAAGGTVALVLSRPGAGTDVHAMPTDALDATTDDPDPLTRVTALDAAFVEEHGLRVERVEFESDDRTVEGIAVLPKGFDPDDPDPRPLLLDVHGGPMSYDQPGWDFDAALWTSRGYVVFRVNYRGSTSYGRAFAEALRGRWNTVEVDDLLAGTDWMVEEGWADPDRLFVTGFSQGGVNTAYLLTRTDRFAAAAAEHGIYDLSSSFGTDDCQNWLEADFGLPWEEPEAYRAASSLPDVAEIETPLLVTAGENDWRCPPTQAEQLYVSVRKRGVPAKLVVYPDEHHAITRPKRAVHRLETLLDWFESHDSARAE
ncbi:S9 family peptidase [Halomarina pelagica]|uniref:S9 family peptidase n=1 Tax=Halomarina pelagica TaxID=2961599 RepID=UPI0020C46285|nr:S9 family peptidase [Halomarina sp. BND7]